MRPKASSPVHHHPSSFIFHLRFSTFHHLILSFQHPAPTPSSSTIFRNSLSGIHTPHFSFPLIFPVFRFSSLKSNAYSIKHDFWKPYVLRVYIYTYIYMCVCMFMCLFVCVPKNRKVENSEKNNWRKKNQ